MLQIITKIPIFIWPLFVFLLLGGLKARKSGPVPLALLLLVPSLFFLWSFFSFFGKYGADYVLALLWFLCLGIGFFIGFSHIQRLKLRFDKKKRKVELPGSWIPLILSMSIFTTKLSLGIMGGMFPHLNGSLLFLGLELCGTIIPGIFVGRGIGCLFRYKTASDPFKT
jgi:hypothetical protein